MYYTIYPYTHTKSDFHFPIYYIEGYRSKGAYANTVMLSQFSREDVTDQKLAISLSKNIDTEGTRIWHEKNPFWYITIPSRKYQDNDMENP